MADEKVKIRELTETTTVDNTDYVPVDSASNGTKKYLLSRIAAQAAGQIAAAVEAEEAARQAADSALDGKIGTLSNLTTTAKGSAVAAINEVDANADAAQSAADANAGKIGTLSSLTTDAKTDLVSAVNEVDEAVTDVKSDLSQEVTNRTAAVSAEASARAAADSALQTAVNAKASQADLTAEVSARQAADDALAADIATKANADGVAENLTSGQTKQLLSDVYATDSEPYFFRPTGGSVNASVGDREYDTIVGGTVAWNQLVNISNLSSTTVNDVTFTLNSDGTITVNGTASADAYYNLRLNFGKSTTDATTVNVGNGHKAVVFGCPAGGSADTYCMYVRYLGSTSTADTGNGNIFYYNNSTYNGTLQILVKSGVEANNLKFKPVCFDLTAMFGTTIADYIYSLETATEGAGVAFFRKLFPLDYYPYDAGTLRSVEGLSAHETVGFNAWDEEWEVGNINTATGIFDPNASGQYMCSKNYIPVLPNMQYYMTYSGGYQFAYDADKNYIGTFNLLTKLTPNNCHYIKFRLDSNYGTTYNHDICINLSWDGERNGEYEEYVKHSYPLDDSLTLRGILRLDAQNRPYFDGDTYEADGTVTRRYGIVDLGTLTWIKGNRNTDDTGYVFFVSNFYPKGIRMNNAVCSKLINSATFTGNWESLKVNEFAINAKYLLACADYADAASFKTAMSGVMLVYELAESTTETADPYQSPQIVDDFGTEEYVTTSIVPVGHTTKYPENLRAKIEGLPWDFSTLIAPTEKTNKATRNYTSGSLLIMGNVLYKVTANIANGGTITPGTNVTATTLSEVILALA